MGRKFGRKNSKIANCYDFGQKHPERRHGAVFTPMPCNAGPSRAMRRAVKNGKWHGTACISNYWGGVTPSPKPRLRESGPEPGRGNLQCTVHDPYL